MEKRRKQVELSRAHAQNCFRSRRRFRVQLSNRRLTLHFPLQEYVFGGDFVKATSTAVCELKARSFRSTNILRSERFILSELDFCSRANFRNLDKMLMK